MRTGFLFLFLTASLWIYGQSTKEEGGLNQVEDQVYRVSQKGFEAEIDELLKSPSPELQEEKQAYLIYLKALGFLFRGEEDRALEIFTQLQTAARELDKTNPRTAGILLMNESQIMQLKGLGYLMKRAPSLEREIRSHLKEHPKDPIGTFLLGQSLLNKPKLFGGDPQEAKELTLSVENAFPQSPAWGFEINLALYKAYNKLKDREKALTYLEKARDLFPDHPSVADL